MCSAGRTVGLPLLLKQAREAARHAVDLEVACDDLDLSTAQDALFRFKVDFVRRRALPLLKNGTPVVSTADDAAVVARLAGNASPDDLELAIAQLHVPEMA